MNKREAVAYAQITLDYMQSSKQAFKLYPRNIVLDISKAQKITRNKIQAMKVESEKSEWYWK